MARKTDGSGPEMRLRIGAGIIILALVIIVVLTDLFGRLLVRGDFSVSDLMLGTLVGALLWIIFGPLTKMRIPGLPDRSDEP